MGEGEEEGEAGGLTGVGKGKGVDSTKDLGVSVGFPRYGLPGERQELMVLVSVMVSVTVTYEITGEELGPLGIRTVGEELGPLGIETGGELSPLGTVGGRGMQLFGTSWVLRKAK